MTRGVQPARVRARVPSTRPSIIVTRTRVHTHTHLPQIYWCFGVEEKLKSENPHDGLQDYLKVCVCVCVCARVVCVADEQSGVTCELVRGEYRYIEPLRGPAGLPQGVCVCVCERERE